jgi:hypothetical protein
MMYTDGPAPTPSSGQPEDQQNLSSDDRSASKQGSERDLTGERLTPPPSAEPEALPETPLKLTPEEEALMRRDALAEVLGSNGISVLEPISRAELDGCLTTDAPEVWSLINAHFASGAAFEDGLPREVIPVGVPGQFTMESIWKALAGRFGRTSDSEQTPEEYVRAYIESIAPEGAERRRGTEAIHIGIQLDPQDQLLALSLRVPENMRELDKRIWEPLEKARGEYRAAIGELCEVLDELNEKSLATFCLCLPKPEMLVSDALIDTVWLAR